MEMVNKGRGTRARIRRTSEICFQCRNRKIKCDGTEGGCHNCSRLLFECSLAIASAVSACVIDTSNRNSNSLAQQLERRRVWRACITCRDHKLKCSGGYPSCSRCANRGAACRYPSSARFNRGETQLPLPSASLTPREAQASLRVEAHPLSLANNSGDRIRDSPTLTSLGHSTELGLARQEVKKHIDAFFDFVYPIPCHGFLHRASLLQAWSKGTLNPWLLHAICGVASRYLFRDDVEKQEEAQRWMQKAETQLLARLAEPRLSDVEAWMLVTMHHFLSRCYGKMLISMSLTVRLAYILGLNREEERIPFLVQERRRRLMWSIFIMETLYSSGRAEFASCSRDTLRIQLPCNEQSFSMDTRVETEPLAPNPEMRSSPNMGILGYCIRVLDIRDRVQRLTLAITNHRKPIAECLLEVECAEQELRQFYNSLPARYHFDKKAFFLRAYSPSRMPFLMLHAWWHQTHCDLYRFSVPGLREGLPAAEISQLPLEFASASWEKCLSHALSVSKILETPKLVGGCDVITDSSLAICAFHSARIISRLGQPPLGDIPKDEIIDRLAACAEALEGQSAIFPTTAVLKRGILELVQDAERGPNSRPSIWESEEAEKDGPNALASRSEAEKESDVYSKHSISEAIRNMEFQSEDGDHDFGDSLVRGLTAVQPHPPDRTAHATRDESRMTTPHSEQMQQEDAAPATSFSYDAMGDAETSFGIITGGYDAGITLGLDPRYEAGQPDLFMDSFWALPDKDWIMPGMNT